MSDQSTTQPTGGQDNPTSRSPYSKGPVTISWSVSGTNNESCSVQVEFEGSLVASNTLSPGDTNWDTGRHDGSNGWCSAAFQLQVPTPGQQGQLELKSLIWEQDPGGTNKTTNQILDYWSYT
ncbi:MAG: hypothetical protein M3320_07995 [Actinomycetota bacterium]|nr:hypothetical protein [Actinomycetota bacterium]MDQ5808600.1 hypothetical protein [Actinomycetota bacterium]